MHLSVIAAMAENRAIGKDNRLLWNLPEDLANFKKTTMGFSIIMGSKTFVSIGRALPGRRNIVLSSKKVGVEGVETFDSIETLVETLESDGTKQAFVIGGAQIYRAFLDGNLVDEILLSVVPGSYEADSFFPAFEDRFILTEEIPFISFLLRKYRRNI